MSFPPEPWALRGQLHLSAFLVPSSSVPLDPPPGWRPITVRGRSVVGTAWVTYEPGGVLTYREVLATVLVRRGWRVLPTIFAIWVDSAASLEGGRALWGIPKELAVFDAGADDAGGGRFAAKSDGGDIATGTVRHRATLPGRWATPFAVVQTLAGRATTSPIRVRARLALDRATFAATPDGPLRCLAGRRPLLSASLRDFRMSFGRPPG